MKVLAILLCAFVAVQGRSAVGPSTKAAVLGENPYIVHLRIAVSTNGFLSTCAGSLIDNKWVLTAAYCVANVRFIWVRYGVVNVINPSLVTETAAVHVHGIHNAALISIYRSVESTANIAPIGYMGGEAPESTTFCGFGSDGADGPGEQLSCFEVTLEATEELEYVAYCEDNAATKFDFGAPLVADGVQVGLLVGAGTENAGIFLPTTLILQWIERETGITVNRP